MNFFEAQEKARKRTALYITLFLVLTLAMGGLIEFVMRALSPDPIPWLGVVFFALTCTIALFYMLSYKSQGGAFVARSLGGHPVEPVTTNLHEKQLLNIVEEMAVASGQPMPAVFILNSQQINAFAAGTKPENAAIAVTKGALQLLSRDELQGVVAHEFGHIYNADMKISLRLAAMVMALIFIFYLGVRLLETQMLFGRRRSNGSNPVALAALVFVIAGAITWFAGALLRSSVSRQREYLADACAVQFTRNPHGIANALRKIGQQHTNDMPKRGMGYAHLYFNNKGAFSKLFATHPPLEKRLAALEAGTYVMNER